MTIGAFRLPVKAGGGGGGGFDYTLSKFTETGIWTKPAELDHAIVLIIPGGGGANAGRRGAPGTPRQGGVAFCGQMALFTFKADDLAAEEEVIVGQGGLGAPAVTTDNTSSALAGLGGNSEFKGFNVNGGSRGGGAAGTSNIGNNPNITAQVGSKWWNFIQRYHQGNGIFGNANLMTWWRAWGVPFAFTPHTPASSFGGCFTAANVIIQPCRPGIYTIDGDLIQENVSLAGMGENGIQLAHTYTNGEFLNKVFPWFDPLLVTDLMGYTGGAGGSGDLAGTIPAGAGSDGTGYGGAGGGGGASTNGANSGAGGNGIGGVTYIINILK